VSSEDLSSTELAVKDVLVVGAGIGGLGAAIALSRRGVRTTVVERDGRTLGANIGITYRALYALRELGMLDQVMASGKCHAVGQDAGYWAAYDASGERLQTGPPPALTDDWELPVIAVQLLRPVLSEIMKQCAREHGVELLTGHTYESLEPGPDGVEAKLTTGEQRHFDLLVAADGVHSELRKRFFPEAGSTVYLGITACRLLFEGVPEHWRGGQHVAPDGTQRLVTQVYPGRRFHLGVGKRMGRRHVEQDEARAIMRESLEPFLGSAKMFDELYERITDDVAVIITPLEWIYVAPPWHRGRVVLLGDAVHATTPGLSMGGGLALEDSVVLADELAKTTDIDQALTAYAERRKDRAKLVVDTAASMSRLDPSEAAKRREMRHDAIQQLIAPY
jgi:2-polyprenyl-6-methoxyphenol hydroxylase-like FAD-dependent oxidoreductase